MSNLHDDERKGDSLHAQTARSGEKGTEHSSIRAEKELSYLDYSVWYSLCRQTPGVSLWPSLPDSELLRNRGHTCYRENETGPWIGLRAYRTFLKKGPWWAMHISVTWKDQTTSWYDALSVEKLVSSPSLQAYTDFIELKVDDLQNLRKRNNVMIKGLTKLFTGWH